MKNFSKFLVLFLLLFFNLFAGLEKNEVKRNFTHLNLGASSLEYSPFCIVPTIAAGRTIAMGSSNMDISVKLGYNEKSWFFNLPRLLYVHYLKPLNFNSLYFSGGASWLFLHKPSTEMFSGIALHFGTGYQFNRSDHISELIEFAITQPAIAAKKEGKFPAPILELSVGIGF